MNDERFERPQRPARVTLKIFSWKPNGTATLTMHGDNINTAIRGFESCDGDLTAREQARKQADNMSIVLRSVGVDVAIEERNGL